MINDVRIQKQVFALDERTFSLFCAAKIQRSFYFCSAQARKKLKHMAKSTLLQDFKAFAVKGNAIDMAVGVIIGGAFGKIVSSIVDDLIMPPIGWLIGGVNFKDLSVKLPAMMEGQAEVTINYGNFIQTVFDFLIVAFCVFMLVRGIQSLKKSEAAPEEPAAPAGPTQEELLAEIRDLLKKQG